MTFLRNTSLTIFLVLAIFHRSKAQCTDPSNCVNCGIQPDCEAAGCTWSGEDCNFVSDAPTTAEPTTASPTTAEPTTASPTTAEPTTAEPTTAAPTTASPTTASPTTFSPTTESPTTAAPTTAEDEPATTDCVGSSSSSSSSSSDSDTSSSSSSSSSGPCSYSSSSSSDSSSEIVVDDDTGRARSPWLAAHLAAKRGTDRVWSAQSVNDEDVQTTADAMKQDEEVVAEQMEWSIGKTTMANLWAMLVVCLLGNACICWIANMKKRKENAYFQRNERETIV